MPNSVLDKDEKLNPGQTDYENKVGGSSPYTSAGLDQLEAFANDPKNKSDGSVKDKEESPESGRDGFYNKNINNSKITGKGNFLKRKGPLTMIVTILLGGGGLAGVLFSPAVGLIHMKEIFTNDLNDQLASLDIRGNHVLRSKLKGMSTGVCTGVKIKCKFAKMSNRQIKKFERAGFKIETSDGKTFTGRNRLVSITSPDGQVFRDPAELTREAKRNPALGRSLMKAFNPSYIGVTSSAFNKTMTKLGIDKKSKLGTGKRDALGQKLKDSTKGVNTSIADDPRFITDGDNKYFVDENGNRHIEGSDGYNKAIAEVEKGTSGFRDKVRSSSGFKKLSGVARGVSIIGIADSACTVYNLSRSVSAAAKAIRSVQLAQYAMVFLNTADKIKAGTATPEEVEYLGSILNDKDMREKIFDESKDAINTNKWLEADNPNYGKSAYDSPGYRIAAYGDTPNLNSQSAQFTVGGGMPGTMSSITDSILNEIGGSRKAARDTCGVIQHPITRIGGLAVGIIVGIFSAGVGTAISAAGSVAIMFAVPYLESYLIDIASGNVVNDLTKGVEAGDAVFAGTASIMGSAAQQHGLKPLTKDELESYMAVTNNVKSQHIEIAKLEAKETPLDIMNQYSFLGSLARTALPITQQASSNAFSFVSSVPKFLTSPLTNTTNTAKASSFNPDRFNKCDDGGYEELNIAADIFCNVRYGLTNKELSMETNDVVDYMLNGSFIDSESGEPDGDYKTFIENCVDRVDGWGESTEENGSIGDECMKTDAKTSNFRVFTIDNVLSDAMDDEVESSNEDSDGGVDDDSNEDVGFSDVDMQELAKKILDKKNISLDTGDWNSSGVSPKKQIENISNGKNAIPGYPENVDIRVLQIIDRISEQYSIHVSSMLRTSQTSGGGSLHPRGKAVDISAIGFGSQSPRDIGDGDNPVKSDAKPVILRFAPYLNNIAKENDLTLDVHQIFRTKCLGGDAFKQGEPRVSNLRYSFEDPCNHIHIHIRG